MFHVLSMEHGTLNMEPKTNSSNQRSYSSDNLVLAPPQEPPSITPQQVLLSGPCQIYPIVETSNSAFKDNLD